MWRSRSLRIFAEFPPFFACRYVSTGKDIFTPTASPESLIPNQVAKSAVKSRFFDVHSQGERLKVMMHVGGSGLMTAEEVSKSELLKLANVQARDLRKILSVSQRRQISSILVRQNCIILHIEHIKALIMHDRTYLFNVEPESSAESFSLLFSSMIFELDSLSRKVPDYEFRVLEAILIEVTEAVDGKFRRLSPEVIELLNDLAESQRPRNLRHLMEITDRLNAFLARIQSLRSTIHELLNTDEDLAAMYLSEKHRGKARAVSEHEEVEILFENYLFQLDETEVRVRDFLDRIHNTENYIKIHFDAQRNRLMRLNLILSMGALSTGVGAVCASVFGMNLLSGYEESPVAFFIVSGSIITIMGSSFLGIFAAYVRSKYMPENNRHMGLLSRYFKRKYDLNDRLIKR